MRGPRAETGGGASETHALRCRADAAAARTRLKEQMCVRVQQTRPKKEKKMGNINNHINISNLLLLLLLLSLLRRCMHRGWDFRTYVPFHSQGFIIWKIDT